MKRPAQRAIAACLFICLLLSITACGNERTESVQETDEPKELVEADRSVQISFLPTDSGTAVSPYIYGQFIEHIEDCVYDGIWAELILDRKFYYEVGDSGLSPWKSAGKENIESVESDTLSGGHAAKLKEHSILQQEGLSFDKKDYTGYFWCKSIEGCRVTVSVLYGNEKTVEEIYVSPNSDFVKYDYTLSCNFRCLSQGVFQIEVTEGKGLFDSLSLMPADNYLGMRRDTLEALKELNATMYRWPGGNFLSGYDWEDGVGDKDRRPSKRNLHYMGLESEFDSVDAQIASDMVNLNHLGFYGGIEPNDFGLDEFMAMCEYLGAEPLMMVNTGLGTVEQASGLVQYCNGAVSTAGGALRAQNGHIEPYGIRYWGVGNEMFGSWQLGHVSLDEYVARHNAFVAAMKEQDPSIIIIASGDNSSYWSDGLFSKSGDSFDLIAEHLYGERDETDVYQHLANLQSNVEYRINQHRALLQKYPERQETKIALTEYAYDKAKTASRLKDAMGIAELLNAVIRNADVFEICCYSSTVNATQGCITTSPFGATLQGAGYVLELFRTYMYETSIECKFRPDKELQLDMSMTVAEDGKSVALAVVNPSEFSVELTNRYFESAIDVKRYSLLGDYYDSYNTTDKEELYLETADHMGNVVAPPMSISIFVIQIAE